MIYSSINIAVSELEQKPVASSPDLETLKSMLDDLTGLYEEDEMVEFLGFQPNTSDNSDKMIGSYIYEITTDEGNKYIERFIVYRSDFVG